MKKLMIAAVVAVAMAMGVYAEEAAPKADAKAEVKVCADCAKLAKDAKEGEKAKLCPACQKKADEAAKAAKDAAK